jgi:hypothetical protein
VISTFIFLLTSTLAFAQEPSGASDAAQANNPLANMTAFNVQQYFIGELTESDQSANQFWLRYAKPFAISDTKWLLRASLPINSYPVGTNGVTETGLSDLNLFSAYLIDMGNPAISFGLGPQLTVPSATEDVLGSEKWSAGLVNVLFNAESKVLQYGYLLSWQTSFAGNSDRSDVNVAAFQPFMFYQLGAGAYLRGAPIWVYNLENDDYSVPLGIGIGQVIKQGKTVYNVFVEPQFSVTDEGAAQPEWQIFMGLNMQFLN